LNALWNVSWCGHRPESLQLKRISLDGSTTIVASMSMTLRERALYHQIHPAKLAIDWSAGLVAAIFFRRHRLAAGLLWGLVPPVAASVPFMLGLFDGTLTRYRTSALGHYLARSMTRAMEGLRLVGLVVLLLGAWHRQPLVIALGLALVAVAWLRGWVWPPRGSTPAAA
jgi:hypothetical protein